MRSCIVTAVLAAILVLTPVAAGFAPALSQDFSITNPEDLRIEGAQLGPDWIKKLQAWWDLHAYYPKEAAEKDEAGIVKIHLLIHANGQVWLMKVVQGSGSPALDKAAFWTFHNMYLQPFPPGTPAPEADVTLSLHYVLTHRHGEPVAAASAPSKRAFTITNDPVKNSVVETWLQKTCSGWVVWGGDGAWGPESPFGDHVRVGAIFYRKPDGRPWVKWWGNGGFLSFTPVTELGVSAQWKPIANPFDSRRERSPYYAVWPAGDNRLSGTAAGGTALETRGRIDLTCETKTVPQIRTNGLLESPEGSTPP